jgi:hypothetical protein
MMRSVPYNFINQPSDKINLFHIPLILSCLIKSLFIFILSKNLQSLLTKTYYSIKGHARISIEAG